MSIAQKLSIPLVERLPGFSQITDVVVVGDRMTFTVIGSTPEFGNAASDLFVLRGLVAILDGREGHLHSIDVTRPEGTAHFSISCGLPR